MIKAGIILLSIFYNVFHPFHISVTDIEYDSEVNSIEIAQKIFTDDFEEALNALSKEKINLIDENQKAANDVIIGKYILKNFLLEINGKPAEFQFLGTQREGDAIWCFMEVSKVKKLKSIRVKNTLLFDMFEDQMNLVHVKKAGEIKSMRLIKSKNERTFEYE